MLATFLANPQLSQHTWEREQRAFLQPSRRTLQISTCGNPTVMMFALDAHTHPTPSQQGGTFPWQRTIIDFHWLRLLWYQQGVCLCVRAGGGAVWRGQAVEEKQKKQGDLMKGTEWENAPADPQCTNRRGGSQRKERNHSLRLSFFHSSSLLLYPSSLSCLCFLSFYIPIL